MSSSSAFTFNAPTRIQDLPSEKIAIDIDDFSLSYNDTPTLHNISMRIPKRQVTAFIGPSGCGKSTLLRSINRLNDLIEGCRLSGDIKVHNKNVYDADVDVSKLRRRVGMVFQKPNPFPSSIYDNVCYGLRLQGIKERRTLDDAVEKALRDSALWKEVKDKLHSNAFELSSGQQQRLVMARAIAIEPEVLLLDEPTSSLDPISTLTIEELINELKTRYTVVIVTHNMQQAARVSDYTAFMHMGKLVEYRDTDSLFTSPRQKQTEDYITGRYG
ncbi:phosphate ABC transporter ATP-binding protein [Vibrio sp. qd031]|uniref:phosphate ABC transporter ATP-binding protein PstB n=1 Tax=Vibrio sp. qd031 TaxID=1603038 RepID=UPI000A114EDD|nr:phosphate ABC transporter ATP-binding protein PstB [Vibrio sp. qd031]ORT49160.1 phosphate ABC transporter ATP-binding protein [Vibrio sp. qd031]